MNHFDYKSSYKINNVFIVSIEEYLYEMYFIFLLIKIVYRNEMDFPLGPT